MHEIQTYHMTIGGGGRVVLPAPLRKRLGLKPGDTLVVEANGGSARLLSFDQVLAEVQGYFRQFATPGVSMVDELIAERRAEAARELEESGGAPTQAGYE